MIWAIITKTPDVLQILGLGLLLYWTGKGTLWTARQIGRAKNRSN